MIGDYAVFFECIRCRSVELNERTVDTRQPEIECSDCGHMWPGALLDGEEVVWPTGD